MDREIDRDIVVEVFLFMLVLSAIITALLLVFE